MTSSRDRINRRTVLKGCSAAAAVALAGCTGGGGGGGGGDGDETSTPTATPTSGDSAPSFDGWLDDVGNYDGVVDATGEAEVTVEVGVEANGGAFGFGPPAVRVDAGTTVTWKWTGEGASHNVVAKDGSYESELIDAAGHTFEQTFESAGTSKYFCEPHKAMGMKGVVVVE